MEQQVYHLTYKCKRCGEYCYNDIEARSFDALLGCWNFTMQMFHKCDDPVTNRAVWGVADLYSMIEGEIDGKLS